MLPRQMAVAVAAIVLASVGEQGAHAATLLELVDAPAQRETPMALEFLAESAAVTLSVGGFQVPSIEIVTQNAVTNTSGGLNLLGPSWTFTSASAGSFAGVGDDGTNVPGILLGANTPGSYDVFSQTFATAVGASYMYSFLYTNLVGNAPSGLRITISSATAVPEPATWAMMLLGFATIGSALRRSKQDKSTARVAL